MAPTRRANASPVSKGLLPGERLSRIPSSSPLWSWVGNAVTDEKDITLGHRLATCSLSRTQRACCNKYSPLKLKSTEKCVSMTAAGELEDDIIVVSDDEGPSCSRKGCISDPNCLNYLGQQAWEDEDGSAQNDFFKAVEHGSDPSKECRKESLPVGLKNLGATCYANASLQVWYRDLTFRSGVYNCEPPENVTEEKYKDSPIFQLQATFAALQEGNKNVFNPIKLVESLQLRTTEQQDAQEFSKLFISHLDAEFKKQSSPTIKTLITDQFQGTQTYGTICHACKNRSERPCDFLELEISFNKNADLQDCLEASLSPERLSGDNKYFCSRCDSLQDATRYTQLQRLPSVLHFSLLRFVYDLSTMERKKSKHSISFPSTLDMRKFMGSKTDRERAHEQPADDDLYELRGILLHKGSSAYHGHYEAQVYDFETGSWFQFNDDVVTKVDSLGDKKPVNKTKDVDKEFEENSSSGVRQGRIIGRKRRRIEDSEDDDIVEIVKTPPKPKIDSSIITSRDAYMLIYSRKIDHPNAKLLENTDPSIRYSPPAVPDRVMDVIRKSNAAHEGACQVYREKTAIIATQFQTLRSKVRNIYMTLAAKNNSESVIVSRQALEGWLSEHCMEAATYQRGPNGDPDNPKPVHISNSDIVCEHGALDPTKWKDMKKIALCSVDEILKETHCLFQPLLKVYDVCAECVSTLFREKLYEIEHPRLVRMLDDFNLCHEGETGYWISKKWLKDWRLNKPHMHVPSESDPAPDSSDYVAHVICEHGSLSMNTTNRRKISPEATNLLRGLFPTWNPMPSNFEMCAICDAEIKISKEDKKESRRRVEEEKALLKFIYAPPLEFWTSGAEDVSFALIPSDFVKRWNRWVANPCSNNPRPESVDNNPFFCEHKLLCFDPNCALDMNSTFIPIQRDQWDTLQTLYPAGPLIPLTRRTLTDEGGFDHAISVCFDCRLKRKLDWETTEVTVRLISSKKTNPSKDSQSTLVVYNHRGGARQSRRLLQNKLYNKQRAFKISISKSTNVRDFKIMVNEELKIPIIVQRLFHRGKELDDNTATACSISIFVNDVLEVLEVEEIDGDTDTDAGRPSKRRREEAGFGGTLLANVDSTWSSSPEPIPSTSLPITQDKPCLVCTFSNPLDALSCEMCETRFP